tara:strand:+ start:3854 stop:4363 length:510 start_codon:yes stop_codon:yes gene_type:complete
MKITRYIGYFSLFLIVFIFSIFFINLFEESEVNFPEKNLPSGEIKTFEGNILDVNFLKKNELSLLNVWATWCINCKLEHGFLMAKKTEGWNIVGLNYKDDLEKAFKWLDQYGNPYSVNLYDQDGEYGFSLGVSGAPETYLLKEDKILQKHIGIMSEKVWKDKFIPLINN